MLSPQVKSSKKEGGEKMRTTISHTYKYEEDAWLFETSDEYIFHHRGLAEGTAEDLGGGGQEGRAEVKKVKGVKRYKVDPSGDLNHRGLSEETAEGLKS
jgi:hypothetical protein